MDSFRVGCLNVRGCGNEVKREQIGRVLIDRKMDVMVLSETKLKGKGEIKFGEVKGVKSGVSERVRAREGVAILLRKEL
jgi:exonuclease III